MSTDKINERLVRNAPKSSEALLELLFDGLDWPRPADMEIEDIPLLGWSPDELHLDPDAIAKLTKIQQLPRLTNSQPFGVFILTFDGGRLPVGAVRRLVNRLVKKKRAQAKTARSLWDLEDLIFFCQSRNGVSTLHIVAFQDTGNLPVLKVITWDTQATENRVQLIANQSLPELRWPDDGSFDAAKWREQWTGAFTSTYREGIRSSAVLAAKMAEVAKVVRDEVAALYEVETDEGPLRQLYAEIRENLRADLTPEGFADMYAQTMVYGLLTARITHPEDFQADALNSVLKFENPFLDALYSSFRRKGDEAFDVDEFGLHDLAEILVRTQIDEVLADFGAEERKDDPVVHFYEEFLEKYDPDQRRELGTYYTPIPIVRFMVRAVDEIIKEEFGLPLGVADQTTWAEYAEDQGIAIPEGIEPTDKVIRMIDPATGTGTYLLEWLRQAEANLREVGKCSPEAMAQVIGQMDAFEISLSSYAVAHLKTSLEIDPRLRGSVTVNIRLADTLAGRRVGQVDLFDDDPITTESVEAEALKYSTNHSVVIGNPPYLRLKRDSGGDQGPGGVVRYGSRSNGEYLLQDFLEPLTEAGQGRHAKNLYNLYVFFWRWAIWKASNIPGPATVSFITASSFLTGPGFAGMREVLRRDFDEIWIVDLGGEGRGARKDENVFEGVLTPVVVVVAVRRATPNESDRLDSPAPIRYQRLEGSRQEKLDQLARLGALSEAAGWQMGPSGWMERFLPHGTDDFHDWPLLTDLMPLQLAGVQFGRIWPVGESEDLLVTRWEKLVSTPKGDQAQTMSAAHSCTPNRQVRDLFTFQNLRSIAESSIEDPLPAIRRISFRSFDLQWGIVDSRVVHRVRPDLWAAEGPRQVWFSTLLSGSLGKGPALTAHPFPPDYHAFCNRGGKHQFPLWRDAAATQPNFTSGLLEELSTAYAAAVSPEDLACYLFGLLGTGAYTGRFSDELASSTPRVPITASFERFTQVAELGRTLLWKATWGERFCPQDDLTAPARLMPDGKARTIRAVPDDIYPDTYQYEPETRTLRVGLGEFGPVDPEVWEFEVSGLKVLQSWIGYRMQNQSGRKSSVLDDMRSDSWIYSDELLTLIGILEFFVNAEKAAAKLLDEVIAGTLIESSLFPLPSEDERKASPRKKKRTSLDENQLSM